MQSSSQGSSPAVSTLRAYVPRHVAEAMARSPGADILGQEHRLTTAVLYSDISGFTPLSEALGRLGARGTEELTSLLNDYFGALIEVTDTHGGIVGKFGGDALTVLFPSRRRAVAGRRAVACALELQRASLGREAVETAAGAFRLELKVGLAIGSVLSLSVGVPDTRMEYVIAGPAVDLAVEAERHARGGEVIAHDGLLVLCPDAFAESRAEGFSRVTELGSPPRRSPRPRLEALSPALSRALAAYLPPAIAELVQAGHDRFVNEHRHIVVLFVGFEGFDYAKRDVGERLRSYFGEVVRTISRFGGHLRQIDVGDKGSTYLVFFGAPVAHEDDDGRACHCALALRELPGAERVRVGIASGLTFCGEVGNERRREYAAVGDTVNLAARLMEAAEPGTIVVSTSVGARAPDLEVAERRRLILKGKTQPVETFVLAGFRPTVRTIPGLGGEQPPLVGREAELALALEALAAAADGRGCMLGLTGEAGVGKSRLTAELVEEASRTGFRIHASACEAHASQTSYFVWHGIWRDFFGLDPSWPLDRQSKHLAGELVALGVGQAAEAFPALGPALNVSFPDTELTRGLDPELRSELLKSVLVGALRRRSEQQPVFLVLEDCHWIDPASSELAATVARSTSDASAALLLSSRPVPASESPTRWAAGLDQFVEIDLAGLSRSELEEILSSKVEELFAPGEASDETVEYLVSRANGNPFFLDEMLHLLHDRGIEPKDVRAVSALALPTTLQSLSLARLDELSEGDRTTLKVASVIGRLFKAPWLWGSYPRLGRPDQVLHRLRRTSRLDLTAPGVQKPEPTFAFKHVVIRDASYASLTYGLREHLHEGVGRYIEEAYAGRLEEQVDALAHHFGETRLEEKQREYFDRAAAAAAAAYANDSAISYLERLLPLTEGAQRSTVLRRLGEIWQLTGNWAEAEEALRAAVELAEESAHVISELASARGALGSLLSRRQSFDEARELLEQARSDFERLDDVPGVVRMLGNLRSRHGNSPTMPARSITRASTCTGGSIRDEVGVFMAVEQTGVVHWHRGDYDKAAEPSTARSRRRGKRITFAE